MVRNLFDKSFAVFFSLLLILIFGAVVTHNHVLIEASSSDLIISEINHAGSVRPGCTNCSFDKWIELYNTTSTPINLKGYKLAFLDSNLPRNQLSLPDEILPGYTNYLIGLKRNNLTPTFTLSGVRADFISGKVLYVSNNESKTISLDLLSPTGGISSQVRITKDTILSAESNFAPDTRFSFQYLNGEWKPSTSTYFGTTNYGSPQSRGILSTPQEESEPVLAPETRQPSTSVVNLQPDLTNLTAPVTNPSSQTSSLPLQNTIPQSPQAETEETTNLQETVLNTTLENIPRTASQPQHQQINNAQPTLDITNSMNETPVYHDVHSINSSLIQNHENVQENNVIGFQFNPEQPLSKNVIEIENLNDPAKNLNYISGVTNGVFSPSINQSFEQLEKIPKPQEINSLDYLQPIRNNSGVEDSSYHYPDIIAHILFLTMATFADCTFRRLNKALKLKSNLINRYFAIDLMFTGD